MPACHQCRADTSSPRAGRCSICGAAEAKFCATCALWELGPLPAPSGLPEKFRGYDKPHVPVKTCPLQQEERAKSVTSLSAACALLKKQQQEDKQVYGGKKFKEALDDALAVFDEIYAASGLTRETMHALISAQLSAREAVLRHEEERDAPIKGSEGKTAAWRTYHGPRRLPKEIRERLVQHG